MRNDAESVLWQIKVVFWYRRFISKKLRFYSTSLHLENLLEYVARGRKEDYNSLVCDKGKLQFNGTAVKALTYFSQQLRFASHSLACSFGCCGGFLL